MAVRKGNEFAEWDYDILPDSPTIPSFSFILILQVLIILQLQLILCVWRTNRAEKYSQTLTIVSLQ